MSADDRHRVADRHVRAAVVRLEHDRVGPGPEVAVVGLACGASPEDLKAINIGDAPRPGPWLRSLIDERLASHAPSRSGGAYAR